MNVDRDLTILEIRDTFLKYVEVFHAEHGYESDFRKLAQDLKIDIRDSSQNQAFVLGEQRVILIDPETAPCRFYFTGWHELSHHLFRLAHDGDLEAYLMECTYGKTELRYALEEEFCFKAAALLLMPTHILDDVIQESGYSPLTVFNLANRTGASAQAAMRRVIQRYSMDVHAVLINSTGYVLDSVSHGIKREKYLVGCNFQIESTHPLITASYIPEEEVRFKAYVPFKGGNRTWMSKVLTATNSQTSRILAFFIDDYPNDIPEQGTLF